MFAPKVASDDMVCLETFTIRNTLKVFAMLALGNIFLAINKYRIFF